MCSTFCCIFLSPWVICIYGVVCILVHTQVSVLIYRLDYILDHDHDHVVVHVAVFQVDAMSGTRDMDLVPHL